MNISVICIAKAVLVLMICIAQAVLVLVAHLVLKKRRLRMSPKAESLNNQASGKYKKLPTDQLLEK